jgi:hypothetical protein
VDDIVIRAMSKWPNVPAVFGWLSLDRRGQWSIRKAAGDGFERVANPKLIEFIGRNYGHDEQGRWYFQNGPQRVYAALDYTPLVHRVAATRPLTFETHTGARCAALQAVWMDEAGDLLLVTERGPGVLLDRDLSCGLEALCYADGHALDEERLLALMQEGDDAAGVYFNTGGASLPLARIRAEQAPQRLGYVRAP